MLFFCVFFLIMELKYFIWRNKGGMCIPNSTTDDLTVNDVD